MNIQNNLFQGIERPLAETLRPKTILEFLGQRHIIKDDSALITLLKSEKPFSYILWGPPGCGKTTLANLIGSELKANFVTLSATNSGLKDIRNVISRAIQDKEMGNLTIIFIDEIHRYTKTQQDALLPYIEDGTISLIGATTENPSFQVVPALLSRLQVIILKPLCDEDILQIIRNGYQYLIQKNEKISIAPEIGEFITKRSCGDARTALNLVERSYFASKLENGVRSLSLDVVEELSQKHHVKYDLKEHYNLASALQKSIRGSDPNAAIYWLAKMIKGGEDPRFIARRLIVTASEDIGLSDNNALNIAVSCFRAVEIIGMPEGRIPLANAVTYLANAKKSNLCYKAIDRALLDIEQNGKDFPVPSNLQDTHYKDASKYGAGEGYIYTHDNPKEKQEFLPEEMRGTNYFSS